ncbi:MAG: hypothetical protein M1835_002540 [Candelina submexicana]|nr:MAG: hypothetical protein M1835_002540 [Candelina submexicana]
MPNTVITESPAEFSELLSGDMVDIYVGPKRKHWRLPQLLLYNTSSYFRKAFEGGFKEAAEKELYLAEDNAAGFEIFVQWMYRGALKAVSTYANFEYEQSMSSNVALYHLANKLCIKSLQNSAIERIVETLKVGKQGAMEPSTVLGIYQNTGSDSYLRKLSVDLAAYHYMSTPSIDIEHYQCCIDGAEGFMIAMMKAIKANPDKHDPIKNWKQAIRNYQYPIAVDKVEKVGK